MRGRRSGIGGIQEPMGAGGRGSVDRLLRRIGGRSSFGMGAGDGRDGKMKAILRVRYG